MTIALVIVLMVASFGAGRASGRVAFWRKMLSDRRLGHHALEKLGAAHRAKVEIVELP